MINVFLHTIKVNPITYKSLRRNHDVTFITKHGETDHPPIPVFMSMHAIEIDEKEPVVTIPQLREMVLDKEIQCFR